MSKRKFSAKQIAAQQRFAAMAKAGKFSRRKPGTRKKAAKRNPKKSKGISQGREFFVHWIDFTDLKSRSFKRLGAAASFAAQKAYDMIKANAGLDTRRGVEIMNAVNQWDKEMARLIWEYPENSHLLKIPYRTGQGEGGSFVSFEASLPRIAEKRKNPVKAGAKRRPPKRNPKSYIIRAQVKSPGGYSYYWFDGEKFDTVRERAKRFLRSGLAEATMRAIYHKLPAKIDNITVEAF